jgi:hypothetical protein
MGTMTYATMQSHLKFGMGNRDDIDTQLAAWAQEAYQDLTTRYHFFGTLLPGLLYAFPELNVTLVSMTTANTAFVARPTNTNYIYAVYDDTNGRKLDYRDHRWYWRQSAASGDPSYWIPYGDRTYLYPTPDDAFSLSTHYRKRPTALSADGDVTVIGEDWDWPIVDLANINGLMRFKEFDKAAPLQAAWLAKVQSKLGAYLEQARDQNEKLRPNFLYLDGFKYR